ncbi:hypothetical protein CAP39_13265 [Sphingomonas sp. IBVSS1]|nr:hypothetical protein CAP39_13265 [Sphingomonas sp. IBVSS1]
MAALCRAAGAQPGGHGGQRRHDLAAARRAADDANRDGAATPAGAQPVRFQPAPLAGAAQGPAMIRLLAGLWLLLMPLAPATAAVRAVFVGIDDYRFSTSRGFANAGFANLAGAVADVNRIRQALGQALGVDFGPMPARPGCQQVGDAAITLVNHCATRDRILAAWDYVIAQSRPQDIVILYFAGHGSRFIDGKVLDQASRYNSTLMPHDARDPEAENLAQNDIIDHEVRSVIDAATRRGVRVITIFDSCNSGTASRDGNSASRSAPSLAVEGLTPRRAPAQYGNLGAWRVHLAASGDGQDARESGKVDQRAGVFTTALARALAAMPDASFADIAARVAVEVRAVTNGQQVPHAEGALRASLSGNEIKVPLYRVVNDNSGLFLVGGQLLGVTRGSRFALYAGTSAALAGDGVTAMRAVVSNVRGAVAQLQLEGPAPADLPAELVARELGHEFGGRVLPLRVDDPAAAPVAAALGFVRLAPNAGLILQRGDDAMLLSRSGGPLLARLPLPGDPAFPDRLQAALGKIARVEQWLAAVRGGEDLCLAVSNAESRGYNPASCPIGPPPASVTLAKTKSIRLGLVNRSPQPRQLYVFYVGPKYDVTLVLPAFGGRDEPVLPGGNLRDAAGIFPADLGDVRVVALSSNVALDATALEQTATDVIDADACLSAVAAAYCKPASASRSGGLGDINGWSAVVIPARVLP